MKFHVLAYIRTSFLWLRNIPLYQYITNCLSIHVLMDTRDAYTQIIVSNMAMNSSSVFQMPTTSRKAKRVKELAKNLCSALRWSSETTIRTIAMMHQSALPTQEPSLLRLAPGSPCRSKEGEWKSH